MMGSKIFSTTILSLLFVGCIVWDAGYTENKPAAQYRVPGIDKVPITYSVSIKSEREHGYILSETKSLRAKIETALRATGMFSSIQYATQKGEDSYHIDFEFHEAGMSEGDSFAVGMLAGYTLLLIPAVEVLTLDGTATLSLQGKPIYSSAKAEEIRCLIWAPMLPFGIFLNSFSAWDEAEEGIVNALCEDVADEHKRRFSPRAKKLTSK